MWLQNVGITQYFFYNMSPHQFYIPGSQPCQNIFAQSPFHMILRP